MLDGATVFHVNVNCSDLEISRRFYCEGLGLTQGTRTTPDSPQPGAAFGLDEALWDAWILIGDQGFAGGAVDLLEWHIPSPCGAPLGKLNEAGWQRIGLMVRDIDAARAQAIAHGGTAWSEPFETEGEGSLRLCFVSDPDGVAVELISAGIGPRMAFVGMTCHDLKRSLAFYESLGFRKLLRVDASRDDGSHLRIAGPVQMEEILLGAPGGGDVSLLLCGFGEPMVQPATARPAIEVGPWRVALLVDDLDAACVAVRTAVPEAVWVSEPAALAMGPGLPELRFVCFRGPDHEVLELIERPKG